MAMVTTQTALQQVMKDTAVDATLSLVATMVGLPRETVTKIVEAGLPMMATVADENPLVFKAMYAQSVKRLPEPTLEFYTKLGKSPKAQLAMADEFRTMYGSVMETLNRETYATEEQIGQVLAATMPAVVKALGKRNVRGNEMGFGRQLRILNG